MILISEMPVNFTAPAPVQTCALPPPYPVQLGTYLNGVRGKEGKIMRGPRSSASYILFMSVERQDIDMYTQAESLEAGVANLGKGAVFRL